MGDLPLLPPALEPPAPESPAEPVVEPGQVFFCIFDFVDFVLRVLVCFVN